MNQKEQLRKSLIGNWRDHDWAYKTSSDHNDSTKFRERMQQRRALIPVTSHIVVSPTTTEK